MTLQIKNTRQLTDPAQFKWKVLVYAFPGAGKTTWACGAPDPGIAACETGVGRGLLPISNKQLDFVEPTNVADFDAIVTGRIFQDKQTVILDSLTDMVKTFIREYAVSMPRAKGNTPKRAAGVPELDDYGVMGEVTRRTLRRLVELDKHIVVTALLRLDKPDLETGVGELIIGPDLPGAMFLGAPAMFDTVMCLKTRQVLIDPLNKKAGTRTERYFITQPRDSYIAKCRSSIDGRPLLAPEEPFNLETGQGSWQDLFNKIVSGYDTNKIVAGYQPTQ